jgi:hypothetical protein
METSPRTAPAPSATDTDDNGSAGIWRAVVVVGLLGVALIHLLDLQGKFEETPYLGWAYLGVIAASVALARLVAVTRDPRAVLGAGALAASVMVGYTINRTVGMPGAMDDIGNWAEPLGLASLFVEAAVVWAGVEAARVLRVAPALAPHRSRRLVPTS